MKLKFLKLVLPCMAALTCLAGCGPENEDPFKNDTYSGTYYDAYNVKNLVGSELASELQRLCFDTHSVYVKYADYGKLYATYTKDHISSEAAPSTVGTNNQRNEYFYTGKISTGVGTREHVWPCANSANLWVHDSGAGKHYVDGNNYRGGGSDLYHIRPSSSNVNTARGNSKFCDFDDPEFADIKNDVKEVKDTGPYSLKVYGLKDGSFGDKSEPADEYKGDIARILVYVWVHYGYRGKYYDHEDMIGRLNLTNVMAYSDQDRCYAKLKEWNQMDPPSETEKLRNETVQGMQGNRNPFVDHPKLLDRVLM